VTRSGASATSLAAAALAEELEVSAVKAYATVMRAATLMGRGRFEAAIPIARESLAMAEELDDDDRRMPALILGTSRALNGDAGG